MNEIEDENRIGGCLRGAKSILNSKELIYSRKRSESLSLCNIKLKRVRVEMHMCQKRAENIAETFQKLHPNVQGVHYILFMEVYKII